MGGSEKEKCVILLEGREVSPLMKFPKFPSSSVELVPIYEFVIKMDKERIQRGERERERERERGETIGRGEYQNGCVDVLFLGPCVQREREE